MNAKIKTIRGIDALFGILLVMLLAQTSSAETAFTNEFWISTNPTGNFYRNGARGTLDNPFDGSSVANFDTNMNSFPPNSTIHLLAGTYQTLGGYANNGGTANWLLLSGQRILGSGKDMTIIQLSTNSYSGNTLMDSYPYGCSNIEVADLTLDCNYSTQMGNASYDGLALYGSHMIVRRVKVINVVNLDARFSDMYGITIGTYTNGYLNSEGNLIEDCEIYLSFVPPPSHLVTGIILSGSDYNWISGTIRDNVVKASNGTNQPFGSGFGGPWLRNSLIEGNRFEGLERGTYDENGNTNNIFANNVLENCTFPMFMKGSFHQNLTYCDNTIILPSTGGTGFWFYADGFYTNIVIVGNNVDYHQPWQPNTGGSFLAVNNIAGLAVANNTVNPGLNSSFLGCANVCLYNNYDLNGNFLTNLNQIASPNGMTRRTVTYSGTGIYTNYANYADKYIGIKGITSANNGKVSIVLPSAVGHVGEKFVVADESGQLSSSSGPRYIRILTTSPNQINGQSSITNSTPYAALTVIADGTNWFAHYH